MWQALLGKLKMCIQNLLLEVSFFMGQAGNLYHYHMCQQEAWLNYILPFQGSELSPKTLLPNSKLLEDHQFMWPGLQTSNQQVVYNHNAKT